MKSGQFRDADRKMGIRSLHESKIFREIMRRKNLVNGNNIFYVPASGREFEIFLFFRTADQLEKIILGTIAGNPDMILGAGIDEGDVGFSADDVDEKSDKSIEHYLPVPARGTGGTTVTKPLDEITFLDIYNAVECVENGELFHFHENPSTNCPGGRNIHYILDDKLYRVQRALEKELASITLAGI